MSLLEPLPDGTMKAESSSLKRMGRRHSGTWKRKSYNASGAVIVQWNHLPTEIQRQLFQHAVSIGEPRHASQLKEEIARFLHNHKDDEAADPASDRSSRSPGQVRGSKDD